MRTPHHLVLSVLIAAGIVAGACRPAEAGSHRLGVGMRRHVDHSVFEELPFGEDDISYLLGYEYHEANAYWQIGVGYTRDPSGTTNAVDYVITPQLNLVFEDNFWRMGTGILSSYISEDGGNSDWTDPYWQVLLGLSLPLFALDLDVNASYVFEQWGDISEFDFGDIELVGWLSYEF